MTVLLNRSCPICSGLQGELLYRQRFAKEDGNHFLQGYDVVACDDCGFAFADGIPEQAWFDAYYGELSKYEDNTSAGDRESCWDIGKLRAVSCAMIPYVPDRSSQIVEIGCSGGRLLAFFRDAGYEHVLGVDPSATCKRLAMERFGIRVITGTFSNLELPSDFADVMVLSSVLEHLRDLDQALGKIAFHLKKGGLVFISVPDASRYAQGEDAPFQEFSVEHVNFFGPGSLTNIMDSHGFAPVAIIPELLPVNFRTTTPLIHGIFRRTTDGKTGIPHPVRRDAETVDGLKSYIDLSKQEETRIGREIACLVQQDIPLLVWGAGTHTLHLLAQSQLGKARILAFIDSNPRYHGLHLLGREICGQEFLRKHPNVPVLISSRAYQEEIAKEILQTMRCTNPIIRLYSLTAS